MMNELEGPMKQLVKATPWRTPFYSLGGEGLTRNKTENKREREGKKIKRNKRCILCVYFDHHGRRHKDATES